MGHITHTCTQHVKLYYKVRQQFYSRQHSITMAIVIPRKIKIVPSTNIIIPNATVIPIASNWRAGEFGL